MVRFQLLQVFRTVPGTYQVSNKVLAIIVAFLLLSKLLEHKTQNLFTPLSKQI